MRPIRAAATALVASLALSACNGADDPADPTSSSTPSGSATAPSTAPPVETPTEPALPKAATKATEAGARAFIAHYWDLINYAQVTGDVKRLKAASGPNCAGCSAGILSVRNLYRDGGHLQGGAYTVEVDKINELSSSDSTNFAYEAQLTARNEEQLLVRGDGSKERSKPGSATAVVAVLWTSDQWRLEAMEIR